MVGQWLGASGWLHFENIIVPGKKYPGDDGALEGTVISSIIIQSLFELCPG
jgi:hypothetical protein